MSQVYKGRKIRARRIDTKHGNRWEAQVDGSAVGRRKTSFGALETARLHVDFDGCAQPQPDQPS